MYHLRATVATARRVLLQLRHDPRTVALLFLMPCLLLSLLSWLLSDNKKLFDTIGPALLAIFPMTIMFLLTSVTTLRERTSGTLERVLAMPIGKLDFILGYALAFGLMAVIQALISSYVALNFLDLSINGPEWFLLVIAVVDALLGMSLGLFISAFARTEFQAVQFMPAIILPQFLLSGLLVPLDRMPDLAETIARCLPMTYAVEAMQNVGRQTDISGDSWRDVAIVASCVLVAIALGAATLRRRSR